MSDPVERLGAAGPPDDPSTNPVLLPPRTRVDIVQDRPAGGTPEEVAAANPALAAAVPETVGKDSSDTGVATTDDAAVNAAESAAAADQRSAETSAPAATTNPAATEAAVGAGGGFAADATGGLGVVGDLSDGSGMEVPELAILGRG